MSHIKILISYHDEHPLIQSDIIQPIQTGCAKAKKRFNGMLRDDVGENISADNPRYCELSAQYWAWKNYDKLGNPDYIGFMHYRRHFMFDGWIGNPDWCWLPKGNVYFVPFMSSQYLSHLSDTYIAKVLKNCDCVVLKPCDVKHLKSKNCRTQYGKLPEQNVKNFDIFIKTAKRLYPDYEEEIEKIEKGSVQYLCNMFVMRKDLFEEYNKFCFSILEEVDKQIDSTQMSEQAARFLGYFGEFLLSMFIFKLQKRSDVRLKELNGAYVLNDKKPKIRWLKYAKLCVFSKITFGERRKKYKKKRDAYRQEIQHLKQFL